MDFTFSADQIAFREAVSRFLMTEAPPELLREIWESESGHSPELDGRIAAQGLCGMSVPESDGGLGLGDVDWALMTQELGYYALSDSLAETAYVGAGLLAALETGHPARTRWLPGVADGTCRIAVGHPVNPLVADAHLADVLLLPHATPQGTAVHAVPRADVELDQERASIDASRRLASVRWEPGAATLVAGGTHGQQLWDQALQRGAVGAAGQLVGLAQRMLDLSVDYVAQRKQFGRPIGAFQAVKHHLADVVTRIEFARPVLYRAAYALAHDEPHAALLASHAKLACADAAWTAARKAMQVHGAMGYTWEVDLQMFAKRAWVLDALWGDRGFHKARIGAALLADEAPVGPAAFHNP